MEPINLQNFKLGFAYEKAKGVNTLQAVEDVLKKSYDNPVYYLENIQEGELDSKVKEVYREYFKEDIAPYHHTIAPYSPKLEQGMGGGYPSKKELKKYLRKLKMIRRDLDRGMFKDKMKPVPDYMKTPIKKLYKNRLPEEAEDNNKDKKDDQPKPRRSSTSKNKLDKNIRYYFKRLENILPDDVFLKLSEEENTVFIKFPPKYRAKSYEKDREKKRAGKEEPADKRSLDIVSDLSFKTPEDALKSISKVKRAPISDSGKIRSIIPSLNRLPSTIKRTKDPKKRNNLVKSLKILQKYYATLKKDTEDNPE